MPADAVRISGGPLTARRRPKPNLPRQALANLLLVPQDGIRPGNDKILTVHHVSRAGDNMGMRRSLANVFEDRHSGTVVRNGNHDCLCQVQTCMLQDVALGGVADDSCKSQLLGKSDPVAIQVDHDHSLFAIDKGTCGKLSCRPKADYYDVRHGL